MAYWTVSTLDELDQAESLSGLGDLGGVRSRLRRARRRARERLRRARESAARRARRAARSARERAKRIAEQQKRIAQKIKQKHEEMAKKLREAAMKKIGWWVKKPTDPAHFHNHPIIRSYPWPSPTQLHRIFFWQVMRDKHGGDQHWFQNALKREKLSGLKARTWITTHLLKNFSNVSGRMEKYIKKKAKIAKQKAIAISVVSAVVGVVASIALPAVGSALVSAASGRISKRQTKREMGKLMNIAGQFKKDSPAFAAELERVAKETEKKAEKAEEETGEFARPVIGRREDRKPLQSPFEVCPTDSHMGGTIMARYDEYMRDEDFFSGSLRNGHSAVLLDGYIVTEASPEQEVLMSPGLGQSVPMRSAQERAMVYAFESFNRLMKVRRRIDRLTPRNWLLQMQRIPFELSAMLQTHSAFIRGKTGNPEMENRLQQLLLQTSKQSREILRRAPIPTQVLVDEFKARMGKSIQGFTKWTLTTATDGLKKFHTASNRIRLLKNDLKKGSASGQYEPEVLVAQRANIRKAEEKLADVRDLFLTITGQNLDRFAQEEHGAYTQLEGPALTFALAAKIAVIAVAIGLAVAAVYAVSYLPEVTKAAAVPLALIGVVAAIVVLPKLMEQKARPA